MRDEHYETMLNGGGPAFPVHWQEGDGQHVAVGGMTLRDYFAGQALQGSDSLTWPNPGEFASKEEIQALISKAAKVRAITAYIVADAMLKVRDAK